MATTKKSTANKAPAQVIRDAKAKIDEIHAAAPPIPRPSSEKHPSAVAAEEAGRVRDEIGNTTIPITLARACELVGFDVKADDFVATAFDAIARDIDTLSDLAERDDAGFEGWAMFQQLAERTRFASEVASLLAAEPAGAEVTP